MRHFQFSELDDTMAATEPQPCVEGTKAFVSQKMVESGACPGQWHGTEGSLHHGSHRRILYDTEARGSQRDIV